MKSNVEITRNHDVAPSKVLSPVLLVGHCADAPRNASEKAQYLVRCGLLDDLSSRVVERTVQKRNAVEHDYATPTLDAAEDVVELLRRVCSAMRAASNPSYGAWAYGSFCHSISTSSAGTKVEFMGWDKPFLIVQRFCADPWIGVVIPDSGNTAVVRRVRFRGTRVSELLDIYRAADHRFDKSRSVNGSDVGRQLSQKMGII